MSSSGNLKREENELIFRNYNEYLEKIAKKILPPTEKDFPIKILCECADETCSKEILIPLNKISSVRQNDLQFIVIKGHEQSDIERTVKQYKNFKLVEKYAVPTQTDGVLNKT